MNRALARVSGPSALERAAAGLSLIVAPALLLLADLLDSRSAAGGESAAVLDGPGRHQAWALVGLLGVVMLVPATLALVTLLRSQRPVLAFVGGSLAVAGIVALAAQRGLHLLTVEMARSGADRAQMQALFDRIEDNAGIVAVIVVAIVGTFFGQLLLTVGLWRAKVVPIWVPVLVVLELPVSAAATSPIASDPLALLALGWIGVIVLRMPLAAWNGRPHSGHAVRVGVSDEVESALR
jgi:hypothetical protein